MTTTLTEWTEQHDSNLYQIDQSALRHEWNLRREDCR